MNKLKTLAAAFAAVSALAACGGGSSGSDDDDSPAPGPAPASAPGGLYVGYYQEDPATNPEDPTPGAFSLNLPDTNSAFTGSMFFTYVGCQTSNVGEVAGTKTDGALSGTWSGTIDGGAESGTYSGSFQSATQSYSGTYNTNGGKKSRDIPGCINYFIAPNGTFEMFAVEAAVPAGFTVQVAGRSISWSATSGAALTLVYVLDRAVAQSGGGNPVRWQTVVSGSSTNSAAVPASVTLQAGTEYIAVVGIGDAAAQRIAFGSRRFTP
jgi:hypothetical protein